MVKRFWAVFVLVFLVCLGVPNLAYGQSPDLVISQGPIGPAQVIRADSSNVQITVKNVGADTVSTQFGVTVYLSVDALVNAGDIAVGDEGLLPPVAPNDSVIVNVSVKLPALLAEGTYQWLAQVDVSNGVDESDEGNNLGVGNGVQVVAPPADLFVVSGPSGANEVNLNGNYTVSIDFKNQGAGPTQNVFDVVVYLSADSLHDSTDVEVGRSSISDKIFENSSRTLQLSAVIPQSHPKGSFRWLAVVDATNSENESNEANNIGVGNVTEVVEKLADLVVSAPPSGPNGVFRRGTYTVTTEVKNQGTGANISDFDVVIFLSEDLIIGNSDDVRVGDVAVSSVLGVDSTRSVDVRVTIPALQTYRSYQWVAVVDDVGFVPELNEANNSLIGLAVSVVPSPPDLIVENVVSSTPVERGNVYSVSLDVVNAGEGITTGAFQVSLFMTVDDSVGNSDDVRVGNVTVTDILDSGDRKALTLSITIPSLQDIGTYKLFALADVGSIETESDEANNAAFSGVPIDVVPSPPDLLFVTDPAGKERVFRGVVDTVNVQIRNQGVGDANGTFDVFVFLSLDDVSDSSDVQVGAWPVSQSILAGQTIDVAIPIVISADQPLGAYRWWARLDANKALNESDETNNDRVGIAVSVVHFPPDVTIFDELTTPTHVARGGIYQILVPVRNMGTGPATLGYQVEVFLSQDDQLDEADVLTGGRKFGDSFTAGAEDTAVVSVSVPIELPVANYRWMARVSVVGLQDESDSGNNVRLGEPVVFPVLVVEPTVLNFGLVRVGDTRSLNFEVLNGGTARLSFEIDVTDPTISVKPQSVQDLPPGVPWSVTVTYTPEMTGVLNATLGINSNDLDGGETVALTGQGETPQAERVLLGFDYESDQPIKNTYNTFVGEDVTVSIVMDDVPLLDTAIITVHYDSLNLAYVDSSWVPAGAFADANGLSGTMVAPGVLELQVVSSERMGGVSGLLGKLTFRAIAPFAEALSAEISVRKFQYQQQDSVQTSLEVIGQATLVYDLVCWADIHGDSLVEIRDFLTFINAFDRSSGDAGWDRELPESPSPQTPYRRFDGNSDGIINLSDFLLLTQVFGQRCSR